MKNHVEIFEVKVSQDYETTRDTVTPCPGTLVVGRLQKHDFISFLFLLLQQFVFINILLLLQEQQIRDVSNTLVWTKKENLANLDWLQQNSFVE